MRKLKNIVIVVIFAFALPAYPQPDVDKAIREIDKSLRKEAEEKLKPPPPEVPEIEREEEKEEEIAPVTFFIQRIKLIGYESLTLDEFQPLLEQYENREVSLEELHKLSKEIQRLYLSYGIIAACLIPPQEIKQETVTLLIVETKMGDLKIANHKYFKKRRLSYYWQIDPGQILRYDAMSRSLQLMNKNPDRKVKATLHAGTKPKTTDILLEVNTHFPLRATSAFDNEGTTFTGKKKTGIGLRHNNFLGFDDSLLTGYLLGSDFSGLYVYHLLPISAAGTSLMYGYSYSKSFPKKEFEAFNIDSRARNASVFIRQDIFKKEKYLGQLQFGIEANDKSTKALDLTLNRDRLRVLRLGGDLIKKDVGAITSIECEFSQGINLFGARRKNMLSSRQAKNTFSKFTTALLHRKALPANLQVNITFKSQLSFTKLASQEEFSLGGIDSIRGYPSGDYLGDTT